MQMGIMETRQCMHRLMDIANGIGWLKVASSDCVRKLQCPVGMEGVNFYVKRVIS